MHLFEEECDGAPEQKPGGGHEPSRACEPVENESISVGPKSNLVECSSKEGTERETDALSYNEVRSKRCSSANSNGAWIRTVFLRIHEERERDAHDHAPDEDQVEKVCLVSEGVTKVPDDGRETAEVDWNLVTSWDL